MIEWEVKQKDSPLGKDVQRLSGPQKVTGNAKYTFDINRPGMLYGRILRSHIPRGKLTALDLSMAKRIPGVRAVIPLIENGKEIRYEGQEIAAVAADNRDIAGDAIRVIRFDYDLLDHVVDMDSALSSEAPQIRDWEKNQSKP